MKAAPSFATLLQRFFTERLMQQRQASPHTISSYRDTFRLLFKFTRNRLRKPPDRIAFEDVDAPLIGAFLNDLQKSRGITPPQSQQPAGGHSILLQLCRVRDAVPVRANPTCAGHPHQTIRAGTDRLSHA